jgi:hypothetical protein
LAGLVSEGPVDLRSARVDPAISTRWNHRLKLRRDLTTIQLGRQFTNDEPEEKKPRIGGKRARYEMCGWDRSGRKSRDRFTPQQGD